MTENHFDITIIGSGPAGYRAAVLAALQKQTVAIIENDTWGGCCLNRGCVPKKDWYHSAKLLASQNHFKNRGIVGKLGINPQQAWQHQQQTVTTVRDSYLNYLQRLGVNRFEGKGNLLGPKQVVIEGNQPVTLNSEHIILATGSQAFIPKNLQAESKRILTTDMLFSEEIPAGKRVAIIGGGVIATEFVFILKQFGYEPIWLSNRSPLANSDFSPQAMTALTQKLKHYQLEARTNSRVSTSRTDTDGVHLELENGENISVDWVLLGTGRRPNTASLNLEKAGINCDEHGFIERNTFLQTACENIYAIGDCTSPQMTANQALADASVAIHNIINDENKIEQNPNQVPQAIYSAVEMARIGLNDDQAEDEGFDPAVGFAAFETSPRAIGQDDVDGFVRFLSDMDSGELLGGEIIGAEAGELIHLLSNGTKTEETVQQILNRHYNHPARAEEFINAAETMISKWNMQDLFKV